MELTFVVSGKLWQRSLVMMDRETKSLWSHLLGKCMQGELKGAQLEMLPGSLTDWATWKSKHPESTVMILQRVTDQFTREMYRNLNQFVAGMAQGPASKAWSFHQLNQNRLLNDTFADKPIVILFEAKSATPFAYGRKVGELTLTFETKQGTTIDRETGSQWDLRSGVATAGKLKGEKLTPLVIISSFKKAWDSFHPKSDYWKPER